MFNRQPYPVQQRGARDSASTLSLDVEHDHVVAAEGDVDSFAWSRRSRAADIECVDVQDFGAETDPEPHDRA
jgi:hypothetical protein